MTRGVRQLLWQIPLTVLASVAGSLVIVWAVSGATGVNMNPSLVAVLSAVLSAAAIAAELRGARGERVGTAIDVIYQGLSTVAPTPASRSRTSW